MDAQRFQAQGSQAPRLMEFRTRRDIVTMTGSELREYRHQLLALRELSLTVSSGGDARP